MVAPRSIREIRHLDRKRMRMNFLPLVPTVYEPEPEADKKKPQTFLCLAPETFEIAKDELALLRRTSSLSSASSDDDGRSVFIALSPVHHNDEDDDVLLDSDDSAVFE